MTIPEESPSTSRRRTGPSRPTIVLAVIVVVAVAAIAIAVASRDSGKKGAATTSSSSADLGTASTTAQPDRQFVDVGTNNGQQFSDAQFQDIAQNFGWVIFTKFHAGWNITEHHAAASKLKQLNPSIHVLPYFSTKYWFDKSRWGVSINPDWLLHDKNGQLVPKTHAGEAQDDASYIDLSNPDYRNWALSLLASWLQAAPYDGIFFDAADPIGDYNPDEIAKWEDLLGKDRVDAYNAGIRDLLSRAKQMFGPDKEVVYNGISPSPIRGPNRDLDLLDVTDGALDERFCLDTKGGAADVREDLGLLESTDKKLFMRTNFGSRVDPANREQLAGFCFGSFLLGWRPGWSYFSLGTDYTANQLSDQHPGLNVDLGQPLGPAQVDGDLGTRSFERGVVVVNLGNKTVQYKAAASAEAISRGRLTGRVAAGDVINVPAHEAVFLTP